MKNPPRTAGAELRKAWVDANGPCKACGSWEDLQVDHIDHRQKKTHKIWGWSQARREEELKNCQVLCGPCNRNKFAQEMGWPFHNNSGYDRGCRCSICKEHHALSNREWRIKKGMVKRGRPRKYKKEVHYNRLYAADRPVIVVPDCKTPKRKPE